MELRFRKKEWCSSEVDTTKAPEGNIVVLANRSTVRKEQILRVGGLEVVECRKDESRGKMNKAVTAEDQISVW